MITEVILDPEHEDPVYLVQIRQKVDEEFAALTGARENIFEIDLIQEGRGTPNVLRSWTIKSDPDDYMIIVDNERVPRPPE